MCKMSLYTNKIKKKGERTRIRKTAELTFIKPEDKKKKERKINKFSKEGPPNYPGSHSLSLLAERKRRKKKKEKIK